MDKVIVYASSLNKVNNILNELKNIGLNVTEFENIKEKIMQRNTEEVNKSYNYANPNLAIGQSAILAQDYSKSIKELDNLYNMLTKYEIYVVAKSLTEGIKTFLKKEEKTKELFNTYRKKILTILRSLNNSDTLDYSIEGKIVEDMYHITYLFIKEEYAYLGSSIVLTKLNEFEKEFIHEEVKKELETIDLRIDKYQKIAQAKNLIDMEGFNASYASESLIATLVSCTTDMSYKFKLLKDLEPKLVKYAKELQDIYNNIKIYEGLREDNKFNFKDLRKSICLLGLSFGITSGIIFGAYKAGRGINSALDSEYMTKTTTYNPLAKDPYTITEKYEKNDEDKVLLIEYEPYKNHWYGINRDVTTYDLSNLEDIPLEEYLNLDLDALNIKGETTTEEKDELALADLYEDTYRIVKKLEVDLNDKNKELTTDNKISITVLTILFSIACYLIYSLIMSNNNHYIYAPIIQEIKDIIDEIKGLKKAKLDKEHIENKLTLLTSQAQQLLIENKDTIEEILNLTRALESNPEYATKLNDVKKNLALVLKKD